MLPEVTRASWFSDKVCTCVCVGKWMSMPSLILSLPCWDSLVDGMLQASAKQSLKILSNFSGFKYLTDPTRKVDCHVFWGAEKLCETLVHWLNERFHVNLKIFLFQLLNIYSSKNTSMYLAMLQLRSHSSDSNTNFDLIDDKRSWFSSVCNPTFIWTRMAYFTRKDITTNTYGKELPFV